MPDVTPTTPATPSTPTPNKPGYFNQAQLADLAEAEDILRAANDPAHDLLLTKKKLTTAWLATFAALVQSGRDKTTETGQAKDESHTSTLQASGTQLALIVALQSVQAARKQQRRMGQMEDPPVEYSLAGYLIGQRLNADRDDLLQNAAALIAKASTDNLPGIDAAAQAALQQALVDYREDNNEQATDDETKQRDRIARDTLIGRINAGRMAIQHAADSLWSYTAPANHPIRRAFKLPTNRPLVG